MFQGHEQCQYHQDSMAKMLGFKQARSIRNKYDEIHGHEVTNGMYYSFESQDFLCGVTEMNPLALMQATSVTFLS